MAATSSPNHSRDGQGSWEFAVPLQDENKVSLRNPRGEDAKKQSNANRHVQANNVPRSAKEPLESRTTEDAQENNYLAPISADPLSRKHSDISGTGSESDSLLDLYKRGDGRVGLGTKADKPPKNTRSHWSVEQQLDSSNWIHRDKLAQIESRELEEAGIRTSDLGRGVSSRLANRNHEDQSVNVDSAQTLEEPIALQEIPQKDKSSAQSEDGSYGNDQSWDFQLSDDTPTGRERQTSSARSSSARPLTSRIPVPRPSQVSSPSPGDRDSRNSKGRKGSNASNADNFAFSKTRGRSGSAGSQVLLDDAIENGAHTPVQNGNGFANGSPPKAKVPSKSAPTSGPKRASNRTASISKPRTSTGSNASKRPGTSGGLSRPPTARPEGEAPWIATMYKPDPSLPPDQQIIPTHAKRMQQEQWEREGKTGSVYDRDFRLLNSENLDKGSINVQKAESTTNKEERQEGQSNPWPLSGQNGTRPGTSSGAEHGGYSTIPKISSPQLPTRSSSPQKPPATSPKPEVTRVKQPDEKDKGCCGGCMVM